MRAKTKTSIIVILLALFFLLIQFIQPERNTHDLEPNHIINNKDVPIEIKNILKVSCFDCHSNQTNYRWYDRISPVSWIVDEHITDGKKEVNFSDWTLMDDFDKIAALNNISDEIKENKMPLKSYIFIHKDAKLSDDQKQFLSIWCEEYANMLLKEEKQQ